MGDVEMTDKDDGLTETVIGASIDVHKQLGPGLLESAYETCLAYELENRKISFKRQLELPINYKGLKLKAGYRIDILVEDRLILELKAVEYNQPIHEAQLLTYLKLTNFNIGLIINFNTHLLKCGIKRIVNQLPE